MQCILRDRSPRDGRGAMLSLLLGLSLAAPACGQRTQSREATKADDGPVVRDYSSRNFRLRTDLSETDAKELLTRLETMLKHVTAYFGPKMVRPVDMFVAADINRWPQDVVANMDPQGVLAIRSGAGVTMTQSLLQGGRAIDAKSVVYAVANHGTPQHEAVHAYCGQAFGRAGPVWYAEGMAEVGQYWRENDKSVKAPDEIIDYLRRSDPKRLDAIVNNPLETSGDSWQNYAWRWALCHLLGFNENYTKRFKPLGLAMLAGNDIDFWRVYGAQAAEIDFEYQFFLRHIEPGYRVDLCSWDWSAKTSAPRRTGSTCKVQAARGWQPSRMKLTAGEAYDYESTGQWLLTPEGTQLSADGNEAGQGRLVGCVYRDFVLTDEFELGATGTFIAPADGDLQVRCRDAWGTLADNRGSLSVTIKPAVKAPAESPQSDAAAAPR